MRMSAAKAVGRPIRARAGTGERNAGFISGTPLEGRLARAQNKKPAGPGGTAQGAGRCDGRHRGQSPGRVGTVGVGCLPGWGGEGSSGGFRRKVGGGGGGGISSGRRRPSHRRQPPERPLRPLLLVIIPALHGGVLALLLPSRQCMIRLWAAQRKRTRYALPTRKAIYGISPSKRSNGLASSLKTCYALSVKRLRKPLAGPRAVIIVRLAKPRWGRG